MQKWQDYRSLLEKDDQYLCEAFPRWLADCDTQVPDNLEAAQKKLDSARTMWEKLNGMKQELTNASHRCDNLGSMDNLDQSEKDLPSPMSQTADQVTAELKEAITQVERRMDGVRDTIGQWESVDRQRTDLRNWLHSKQEELQEMEQKPAKLHAEAAELEIANLQALREEVQGRGPAIDGFLNRYRELTQHNPALVDPVMRAVREDWEELLGQIENLLEDREQALQGNRDLQEEQTDMDKDLAEFVQELEKIEAADVSVVEKSNQLKRRKCRATQTIDQSARSPGRRSNLFGGSDDSDDDDDDDYYGDESLFRYPSARGGAESTPSKRKIRRGLGSQPQTPHSSRRSHGSRPDDLKKGAAAAGCESESEESGYGETYYTMHASSFDTVDVFGSQTLDTMRGTPSQLLLEAVSDAESTGSYIIGDFPQINPEDLQDAACQTPAHARTQTPSNMWGGSSRNISTQMPRNMQTQTDGLPRDTGMQTSNHSLNSIGNQTKRSLGSSRRSLGGSRTDLLRSILMDVKTLKSQRGLGSDTPTDDARSVVSNGTLPRDMLNSLSLDVRTLKDAGSHGVAATQTLEEQGTQTGMKIFPEGDPVRNSRHGRLRDLMSDVKELKDGNVNSDSRSQQSLEFPYQRSRPMSSVSGVRNSPVRFATPVPPALRRRDPPQENGFDRFAPPAAYPPMPMPQPPMMNATAPPMFGAVNGQPPLPPGRVTQDDLSDISDRIDRLRNYQIPPRRQLPPPPQPPPPPQYVVPVFSAPPAPRRRVRIQEFPQTYDDEQDGFMSDESEYDGGRAPRRRATSHNRGVRDRYGLDGVLAEATDAAQELKILSKKMRDSLRDELISGP